MASPPNGDSGDSHPSLLHDAATDAALAQAFKDLARGEKTAQALESNLASLEKRIDQLLASFEAAEQADSQSSADEGQAESVDEKEIKSETVNGKETRSRDC